MNKTSPKIVAIDGPAGSGKSTIASLASKALNWDYLNTGTLYRLVAYLALKEKTPLTAVTELTKLIGECQKDLDWKEGLFFYKGEEISKDLQGEDIGMLASKVAQEEAIRKDLLPIQRQLAKLAPHGIIIDGRDIGTVVFPNADLKIYMTADIEARAQRRYTQLTKSKKSGSPPKIEDLIEDLKTRDLQDSKRACAPLQKAKDAIAFDTSFISIEECVIKVVDLIKEKIERT